MLLLRQTERKCFPMLDRPQIKEEAKGILQNARVSPYVFTLILLAVVFVLDIIKRYTSGAPDYMQDLQSIASNMQNSSSWNLEIPPVLLRPSFVSPSAATFIGILITLVKSVLEAGNAIYHLGIRRGREMPCSTLLDGFRIAGRVILLVILETVFITLWAMLFIIPGIIAVYRYRFALYNLLENPELNPLDAITMSKQQTYGHKWELFVLDLSFLGWSILSALTLGLLSIWLTPYVTQTDVGFFQAIKAEKGIGVFPDEKNAPPSPFL